jgi:hypothetical protein
MPKTKIDVKKLTREQLEKFYTVVHETMGEAVHTGFRKGVDGGGSAEVWQAIHKMPDEKYGDFVEWVLWAFRYSAGLEGAR